jgi:biopolymer transport protein ExbD
MGDIAFLLIIFFMVCSELSKEKDVPMVLPMSKYVEKVEIDIAARVSIDETGQIWLDGQGVNGPKDVEWGVRALLANAVSDKQRHVQLKCDASLTRDTFQPVIQAISEAGGIIQAVGEKIE